LNKSELERHKMWEHPVPLSPFEERPSDKSGSNTNNINPEDVQRLTSDVVIGTNDKDGSPTTTIKGGAKGRKVAFKSFKINK
jgi:hypothetical protein